MLSLAEAQAAILARIQPATRTELLTLARAHGRYAATALHALVDNPAFDNSAMDGYALNSRDLATHNFMLPVHWPVSGPDAQCPAREHSEWLPPIV